MPPAGVRQVPVVVVEGPDMIYNTDLAGRGRASNQAYSLDLTLKKVGKKLEILS